MHGLQTQFAPNASTNRKGSVKKSTVWLQLTYLSPALPHWPLRLKTQLFLIGYTITVYNGNDCHQDYLFKKMFSKMKTITESTSFIWCLIPYRHAPLLCNTARDILVQGMYRLWCRGLLTLSCFPAPLWSRDVISWTGSPDCLSRGPLFHIIS